MLYVQDSVVLLHTPKQLAVHTWWITLPASSRSLLVTWTCLGPPLTGGRHSFSPRPLQEGWALVHHQGWIEWHRERLLHSPATPAVAKPFLFCGYCFISRCRPERWALGWCCPPMWAGGFTLPSGPHVSEVWTRVTASFATTTSSLLPRDNLVDPCHDCAIL